MMAVVERETLSELPKGFREQQARAFKQWLSSLSRSLTASYC
ncbi:hypothetical protein M446_0817 [Methylobacterium sp. 4-46]|nr:hypothetical protein M446_0817 [Methylobacterium sp. 4-46]